MLKDARIFVAGHRGLVGGALYRRLRADGYTGVITRNRSELDLTNAAHVEEFFAKERPDYVMLAAARVGGIKANSQDPALFLTENLRMQLNVIDAAYRYGATKLLFLGSSCIYPKMAPQPLKEDYLLTGELEPTNEWYAIAKIAGIKQCQAYRRQYGFNAISVMPTNLYGPGDNFDLQSSHVLPALMRKFHEARAQGADQVVVWGSGQPRREFMHVDDLVDACLYLMKRYDGEGIVNVGWGVDLTVQDLAQRIKDIVGFRGDVVYDTSMPDGTPRKLLDTSKLTSLGWSPRIELQAGLRNTYEWFQANCR